MYLFDDYSVLRELLDTGKAPYLKDLEQKDRHGQLIVLGLRAEDRDKDLTKVAAHRFLQVSQPPASKFYGEIRQKGVNYLIARYGDMIHMNKIGEPIFSLTEIASGSNGERVVYVLAKEEKHGRADQAVPVQI